MASTLASAFTQVSLISVVTGPPPASQGTDGSILLLLAGTATVLYESQPYALSIWNKPPALS